MKHLRYDLPVSGDALLLGARRPRRDELPKLASDPQQVRPGVYLDEGGRMFTLLEVPPGQSPEDEASARARLEQLIAEYGADYFRPRGKSQVGEYAEAFLETAWEFTPPHKRPILAVWDDLEDEARSPAEKNALIQAFIGGREVVGAKCEVRGSTVLVELPPGTFKSEKF